MRAVLVVLGSSLACVPACRQIAGISDISPCTPGCIDDRTRLLCVDGERVTERCDDLTPTCHAGACLSCVPGAPCGAAGTCNEGGACVASDVTVASTYKHTCARMHDGLVYCWGNNDHGQIDPNKEPRPRPTVIRGLPRAKSVATGYAHSCIVAEDDSVWCWGNNLGGQLGGEATSLEPQRPVRVRNLPPVKKVHPGYGHTCAVALDDAVWCWGYNDFGQCGVPATDQRVVLKPVKVAGLGPVERIAIAKNHACAIERSSLQILCWGANKWDDGGRQRGWGILGRPGSDGADNDSPTPIPIDIGGTARDVGVSWASSCAIRNDERVLCWGYNGRGQLGDGTTEDRLGPVEVSTELLAAEPLANALRLFSGSGSHMCTQAESGFFCWGANDHGELAFGADVLPRQLFPLAKRTVIPVNATELAAGDNHQCWVVPAGGNTRIECVGKDEFVAMGPFDGGVDQTAPASIRW